MGSSTRVYDTPQTPTKKGSRDERPARPRDPRHPRPVSTVDATVAQATSFRARFAADRPALVAACVLAALVIAALVAPWLTPDPNALALDSQHLSPSWQHPMGTDDVGRDVLARVLHGARMSLTIAFAATLVALLIGVGAGAVSGYAGGWADALIMRLVDFMLAIPVFFIVLLLSSLANPGLVVLCALIGGAQWMEVARIVRADVLRNKSTDFVEAARALGLGEGRIVVRHVLPQAVPSILVASTLGLAQAIMMESALSFLGFGVQPPAASWGAMLHGAQTHVWVAPWLAVFPGLMIATTVLCCYLVGDGARRATGPTGA